MKKLHEKITLSVLLAATLTVLTGCGSDDTTAVIPLTSTATDITVERGKVYNATVVDASTPAQVAVQKQNQNVYTFAAAPTYPITVTGGWIDVNNNGTKDTGDVPLDITMRSYSTNVTPISTYLADGNDTQREERLQSMLTELNTDGIGDATPLVEADLFALPSQANQDVIVTSNAIYQEAISNNSSLTDVDFNNVMSDFASLEGMLSSSDMSSEELAQYLEENVIAQLYGAGDITYITDAEVADYLAQFVTEPVVVTQPTTGAVPDLSAYNIIYILNNTTAEVAASVMSTEGGAPEGAQSTIMATNIHCTDFGYTNLISTIDGENGYSIPGAIYTDATYQKSCTEFDYSGQTYGSGTTNVVGYANITTNY